MHHSSPSTRAAGRLCEPTVAPQVTAGEADELLAVSLAEILCRCAGEGGSARLVVPESDPPSEGAEDGAQDGPGCRHSPGREASPGEGGRSPEERPAGLPSKRRRIEPAGFHSTLRLLELSTEAEVADFFRKNLPSYRAESGVLAFLYSLIQTKVGKRRG
ncbi:hypothetical protein FJT64_003221 [Amphibalanus amphitrite]|uniref:Uncharacterized protein n=1 Tax=Amphibalanus amphitrite TaxID=1232801 RepID=A0A6A4WB18_AMPAM|nr:hypothetical protein FJT64_003221 [Amphibalanus amphitrite]